MLNLSQQAIIKKDIKAITYNKRLFPVLLIIPAMFSIVIPAIFVSIVIFNPDQADFQALISFFPTKNSSDIQMMLLELFINSILPVFFILIPIMSASVMAASSFVGEKEKSTLETLLYSPLTLKQLFQAKIVAALLLSLFITALSFVVMVLVIQLILSLSLKIMIPLNLINWGVNLLLLVPAVSLFAITLIVSGSAKAQTIEESQQRSAFLVVPFILLLIGQFTGLFLVNAGLLVLIAGIFFLLFFIVIQRIAKKYNYEFLLL